MKITFSSVIADLVTNKKLIKFTPKGNYENVVKAIEEAIEDMPIKKFTNWFKNLK